MRTETIKIYQFSELSEKAKQVAREWWLDCELQDPAWFSEHFESMKCAVEAVSEYNYNKQKVLEDSENCNWTGYCADAILADWVKKNDGIIPSPRAIEALYQDAWQNELDSRCEPDYIDEQIEANEYEFLESGKLY